MKLVISRSLWKFKTWPVISRGEEGWDAGGKIARPVTARWHLKVCNHWVLSRNPQANFQPWQFVATKQNTILNGKCLIGVFEVTKTGILRRNMTFFPSLTKRCCAQTWPEHKNSGVTKLNWKLNKGERHTLTFFIPETGMENNIQFKAAQQKKGTASQQFNFDSFQQYSIFPVKEQVDKPQIGSSVGNSCW